MDPLTTVCRQSILQHLLPTSMIAQLVRHGPETFATALGSDELCTPEVIWSRVMRHRLLSALETFMSHHSSYFPT